MASESDNIWFYHPNLGAAAAFAVFFGFIGIALFSRSIRHGGFRFVITAMTGALFEIVGFSLRAAASNERDSIALYAAPQTLIVLAPLFIAAANYLMISRIVFAAHGSSSRKILGLKCQHVTPVFVTCDVMTLLIQCSGTSISASVEWVGTTAKVGNYILIAGLAVQTATICYFIVLGIASAGWDALARPTDERWVLSLRSVLISSAVIEFRCIYRLVEFAMGIDGYLFQHEWPFYIFEALPMMVAIGIHAAMYPPQYVKLQACGRKCREGSQNQSV